MEDCTVSYAIGNIIFGIPLELDVDCEDGTYDLLNDALENFGEADGFHTFYSGMADAVPAAFGVVLDCFDEACFSIDIHSLKLEPSDAQRRQFYELWSHLEPDVQAAIEKFGTPRSFILWSTS